MNTLAVVQQPELHREGMKMSRVCSGSDRDAMMEITKSIGVGKILQTDNTDERQPLRHTDSVPRYVRQLKSFGHESRGVNAIRLGAKNEASQQIDSLRNGDR